MERLMQYVWQHRLWPHTRQLTTVDGREVRVISPGTLNTDSGPDFFNAKIMIDGHLWAGDVEIHVRASDWYRHGHHTDSAYNSVILHVVDYDDQAVARSDGQPIDQLRLPCNPEFRHRYDALVNASDSGLPCAGEIDRMERVRITDWIQALGYERLYERADRVGALLRRFDGDWESVCYVTLARALGFGINGDCFERLALATPLRVLGRHADDLFIIEALLLGQSGLLDAAVESADSYVASLQREYRFMAHKFGLAPMASPAWKMARMRPANFPHRRIAILAAILHGGFRMLSRIVAADSRAEAESLFAPTLSGYWRHHYHLADHYHDQVPEVLGRTSVVTLCINVVAALRFAYGYHTASQDHMQAAVDLLTQLPAERNRLVEPFTRAGIECRDAFASQALIQLHRGYCEVHKCLYCRIGHRQLASCAIR